MPETPNLDDLSHAEFDARLVQTWQPRYPWTRSLLPEDPSMAVTPDAFRQHAQARLLAHIRMQKGQSGYQDGRAALEYAAFELVDASAKVLHLRQRPLKELAERFRRDMLLCLRSGELSTYHAWSPRWGKGMQRPHGGNVMSWNESLTSKWDKLALEALAGGHIDRDNDYAPALERVGEMLHNVVPNLAKIDTGSLAIRQQEWRTQMWEVLGQGMHMDHATILRPEAREAMLDASFDGLVEELPDDIESGIREQLAEQEYRAQRRAELSTASPSQITGLLRSRNGIIPMHAGRDMRIAMIINAEIRRGDHLQAYESLLEIPADMPGPDFVRVVAERLLKPIPTAGITPEVRRMVTERLRVLASHAAMATDQWRNAEDEGNKEAAADAMGRLDVLQDVFQRAIQQYGIDWQDMPYFAHLKFILASQMESVDPRELRSFL